MAKRDIPHTAWRRRERRHRERLAAIVEAAVERRSEGRKHPVEDFLFEYYRFGSRRLLDWSPGHGWILEGGAAAFAGRRGFRVERGRAWVDAAELPPRRRPFVAWLGRLLAATAERPPLFGCFGMHEWAMVYRAERRRHPAVPLRLPAARIERTLESVGLACSHFDASRFFTPAARRLQARLPTRDEMIANEQRGCLHANMDLYRWTSKLYPWTSGELLAETFLLARRIREVDMRASPYDLSAFGLEPIRVESEDGRREYRRHQAAFAAEAQPLRRRLAASVGALLAAWAVD